MISRIRIARDSFSAGDCKHIFFLSVGHLGESTYSHRPSRLRVRRATVSTTGMTMRFGEQLYLALATRGGNRWSSFWFLVGESCFLSDFCCDLPEQKYECEVMEAYLNISKRSEQSRLKEHVEPALMIDLDRSIKDVVAVSMMASQGCAVRVIDIGAGRSGG